MPVDTLLLSGPRGAGKSTLARMIRGQVLPRDVHYLRMIPSADGHTNTIVAAEPAPDDPVGDNWRSFHKVTYTTERAFETLPDALRAVRRIDRYGFALIEADSDPALRHAYPYDYRVFVMAAPDDLHAVFRDSESAAKALQQVMQDTATFASEIFGLFESANLDDSIGVYHNRPIMPEPRSEPVENLDISESQIRQFISSPLGAEIASRIQLQPDYHAMVESDVVVINTGRGRATEVLDTCVQRIEKLLARLRHDARRHSVLYWGDISDTADPTRSKLVRRLRTLLAPET